jgi:hypothetical protein
MTPEDFADVLGWDLLCRGVSYDPARLLGFAREVWPLARREPDPARWAGLFLAERRLDRLPGRRGRRA